MKMTFDQNLFTQVGLDSGALTMLGGVTHRFLEPGQYRGVVYRGRRKCGRLLYQCGQEQPGRAGEHRSRSFRSNLPAPPASTTGTTCGCQAGGATAETKFEVNPKGICGVSRFGRRRRLRCTRQQSCGGSQTTESVRQPRTEMRGYLLRCHPAAGNLFRVEWIERESQGQDHGLYPKIGKTAYRPPSPAKVTCSEGGFEPANLELQPGQAVLFQANAPSRITLELVKADDGPAGRLRTHARRMEESSPARTKKKESIGGFGGHDG